MAFKMKGHTLPGIKQLKSNDLDDGRSGSAAFQQSDDPFAGDGKKNNDNTTNVGYMGYFRDKNSPTYDSIERFNPPIIKTHVARIGGGSIISHHGGESSKESSSNFPFKQSDPFAGSKKEGKYDKGDTSIATATITKKATEIPFVDQTIVYPDIADLRSGDHQGIVKDLPNDVFKGNKNTGDGADIDADKYSRYLSTL